MLGRIPDRPDFNLGTAGRNAYDKLEARGEEGPSLAVHLLDESPYHHFSRIEVGDHAVLERTDCLDSRIFSFMHQLGLVSKCDAFPAAALDCHDAWLVKYYLIILEDDGVGSAQIHRKFLCQK